MGFEKGKPRAITAGRIAGTPNKNTLTAKENIAKVFDLLQLDGNVNSLEIWANENPNEFYTKIWIKLIPTAVDLKAEIEGVEQVFKIGNVEITL